MSSLAMTHKLACGMRTFLMLAIRDHMQHHEGQLPKMFVLHHSSMAQLAAEDQRFVAQFNGTPDYTVDLRTGEHHFQGVKIIRLRAGWPSMMTCKNRVEVL